MKRNPLRPLIDKLYEEKAQYLLIVSNLQNKSTFDSTISASHNNDRIDDYQAMLRTLDELIDQAMMISLS